MEHLLLTFNSSKFNNNFSNVHLDDLGNLILDSNAISGFYESKVIEMPNFKKLIASWNSNTSKDTSVEIWVRIRKDTLWSTWFTYGKWSDKGQNTGSFSNQKDKFAMLDVDVISVLDKACDALQFKINLNRKEITNASPVIRNISFTYNPDTYDEIYNEQIEVNKNLEVLPRAQLSVPEIGNIICSPTSLSMVMSYHGINESIETVAAGSKDNGTSIYGNWVYNVAYAGERNLFSYIEYCNSINTVKAYIQRNIPLVASIRVKNKEDLEGAEQAYPSGHLVVITGFTIENDIEYIFVNDPATKDINKVKRKYKLSQFEKAWKNIIYVVNK